MASKKSQDNDPIRVVSYVYAKDDLFEIKDGEYRANPYGDIMHFAQAVSYGELRDIGHW